MRRTLAAVLALSLCSCSFVFTRSPGNVGKPPQKFAQCVEGRGFPIADAVIGGLLLLSSLSLLTGTSDAQTGGSSDDTSTVPAVLTGVGLAAVFGASSYFGFTRTSRCRASHAEYIAAHPAPALAPVAAAPMGANGGACTAQLTCDTGLVCSGMPDHTNKCIPAPPQMAQVPPAAPPPPATPPPATAPPAVTPPPAPTKPAIPVGMQGGACTPQLTCVLGLVCAGQPDHTNKCMPAQGSYLPPQKDATPTSSAPAVGAEGGACTAKLTCNQGLVCSGMPDRTNKCIVAPQRK